MDMNENRMNVLVEVLIDEVSVLRDMTDGLQKDLDRKDQLLAEKAEIIKMLWKSPNRGKVTNVTSEPKKRGPGRPKGSKNGKSK